MATGGGNIPTSEDRSCTICLQTLKEPTTLPCQHTFCKPCISQYISSKENKPKQRERDFSCPVCRTDLTSHNAELSKLGSLSTEANDMNMGTRDFHCVAYKNKEKETLATKWCRDCQETFCQNCLVEHNSFTFLQNHKVLSLKEIRDPKEIEHLDHFSDKCPTHPKYSAEAYCFDHEQLCCISCLTYTHRKCEKIHTICDLVNKEILGQPGLLLLQTDLSKIQTATTELLEDKRKDKSQVEQSFLEIEESMNATVLKIKDNLDTLMISFRKELHLKQDDYESEVDPSIEEIKTFKDLIDEAVEKAEFVRNYGTPIQLFIHLQKIKDEIKEAIDEQFKLTLTAQKLESQLIINDVVEQLEKLTCLGQVRILKKEDQTIKTFNSTINGTFCKVPCFDSIRIVKEKIIEIGEDVRGGTSSCVGSIVLMAIFSGKIIALDLLSEQKIATFPCHTPKRLTYNEASSFLYISCYSGYLYRVKYDTIYGFSDSLTIKSSVPFNGGVCCNGTNFFTLVENGIYKDDNMVNQVYRTNTSCANNLNGLAYDRRNKLLQRTMK